MVPQLFFLVVLSAGALEMGQASKCDDTIVAGIKKIWGSNVPKNMGEQNVAAGKEVVVATTDKYFADGTKCVYSVFKSKDKVTNTIVPESGAAKSSEYAVEEADGALYTPGSSTLMYQIPIDSSVRAVYKCTKDGSAGAAEAMIKVKSGYDKASVTKAKTTLKGINISIVKDYPDTCE